MLRTLRTRKYVKPQDELEHEFDAIGNGTGRLAVFWSVALNAAVYITVLQLISEAIAPVVSLTW